MSLSIKTKAERGRDFQYKENLSNVTTFLERSDDRIECKNGASRFIDIYENGKLIFSGDKFDLFNQLKKK